MLRICDDRFLNYFLHQTSGLFGITFLTQVEELLMQSLHSLLKMSVGCIPLAHIIRTPSTNISMGFWLEMFVRVSDVGTCVPIIAPKEFTIDIYIVFIYFCVLFAGPWNIGSWFWLWRCYIFSSNICSSGSLQGVLAGSYYNRTRFVHEIFAEVLERTTITH